MRKNLSVLRMIQRKMPELNGKARIIAENILADPESVIQEKASDLAKRSGVDSARVVRLCQQLGFEGFPDLKKQLVDEFLSQRSTLERQIAPANTPIEKLKVQFATDFTRTINDTLAELDETQLKKALTLFSGAKCIYLAGYGSSALAAQDMQTKLLRLGFTAIFLNDHENLYTLSHTFSATDLLVLFSFSGSTESILKTTDVANIRGVPVLALTGNPSSPLAKKAELTLLTVADEEKLRVGAMSSVISQFLTVDILISLLAGLDRSRTENRITAMQ